MNNVKIRVHIHYTGVYLIKCCVPKRKCLQSGSALTNNEELEEHQRIQINLGVFFLVYVPNLDPWSLDLKQAQGFGSL